MCFRNGSLQQNYLKCLSSAFKNKLEYQNYLEHNLCMLDNNNDIFNLFHALFKRKNVDFLALRQIYDLIMSQFEMKERIKHLIFSFKKMKTLKLHKFVV